MNIEQKRIVTDTIGWAGSADLGFRLSKNIQTEFALSTSAHLQFKTDKSLYLFLGNIALVEAGDQRFVNSGFSHLRYNRKFGKMLRWEAFTQIQYNKILKVNQRVLAGAGPRLKLVSTDHFKLYQGTLYMYEYEEVTEPEEVHCDHRVSAYVSASWFPSENTDLSTTWYFQPLIEDVADFRLAGQLKLSVGISKHLKFTTSFNYLLDRNPPIEIPQEVYALANGLKYSF